MTTDGRIRASDDDRESAVEVLRDAYAVGRLNIDEFGERTTSAYSARTWGELRALTDDLPEQPVFGTELRAAAQDKPEPEPIPAGARPEPRRPFVPMLPMALVWLAIAAAAHASAAVIPLVLLSLFAFRAAGWRRRPPDPAQPPEPSRRADDTI
jgi:DUF1707 SHOCT-like domain